MLIPVHRSIWCSARRGRVYLPQDELTQAGLSDEDIFQGEVTDKWRSFMKEQIKRARTFFDKAEKGVAELNAASRWPVWASLLLYKQILDAIEANDYNNFTKRAYVGKAKKLVTLPIAYGRALVAPTSKVADQMRSWTVTQKFFRVVRNPQASKLCKCPLPCLSFHHFSLDFSQIFMIKRRKSLDVSVLTSPPCSEHSMFKQPNFHTWLKCTSSASILSRVFPWQKCQPYVLIVTSLN